MAVGQDLERAPRGETETTSRAGGPEAFEAALRSWLTERHGSGHPMYEFWVQDHVTKAERVATYHLEPLGRFLDLGGARVLDVGCGTGAACVAFGRRVRQTIGVDRSETMIRLVRLRAAIDGVHPLLVQADGLALPFREGYFHVCCCDQVLEHIRGYPGVLREIYRILQPGGIALIAAPHRLSITEVHSQLLFASWLPHRLAKLYVKARGRRKWADVWDVWLPTPWGLRRSCRRAGFQELLSPWTAQTPSEAPRTLLGRLRRLLERVPGTRRLVQGLYRCYLFGLTPSLMFILRKPGTVQASRA
jgi:ubiquinone/menaquinone biosynthesis C-methylase UbiE